MLKVILFLETIVKKPIFVLKKDFEAILKSEIGCTKLLLSDSNEIFIDDIVEESLIINEETKEKFPIHRIFVQGVECEQDYCNVGWILNEDMPVCSLCRIEFSPFDMKQHCKACGNICCQDCSSNVVTITGLEVLGGLRVCNLCFYGQDKVSLVGSRHTTRFEIINQGDLEKGLTDIIKVKDRNNKGNNYDGVNRRSILPSTNDLKLHLEGNNHGSLRRKSATALKEQLRDSNKKRDSKILSNSMIDLDTDTTTESMASTTTTKEVETLLSISEPARLVGSKSSRFDTSLTPTLPKTKEEILATLQPPPKIMGWLRKRGHLIQNWKSRYFVLDNGFLTYYLDKIDRPPYGKNVKGQICLAGYREKKESIFHDELASESGRGNSGIAMTISRDSSKTTTNVLHMDYLKNTMIHLEYTPGIVKEDVILYLKHSNNRSPDHTFQNEDSLTPNNSLQFYEFILETNSMEEKVSWCAAIQQHTEYIENISQSIKNCNDEGRLISDDFNHYKSLTDDQSSASSSNPSSPGSDHRNNHSSNKNKKDSKRSSYSFRGNTKNSSPPPQRSVDESGMISSGNLSASMAARPLSLRQSVIHSQKYHIFIYSDEIMIFSGLIGKPNKVSVQKFRELVFVKTKGLKTSSPSSPNNKTTTGTSSLPFHTRPNTKQLNSPTSLPSDNNEKNKQCLKRLLYIDTSKYELKGDIRWIENEPSPTIKAVGDKYFEIYDQRLKKSYHFYPKDGATVTQWIEILNGH